MKAENYRLVCSWHSRYNNGESLVMQEGDEGAATSHSCCSSCLERILGEMHGGRK